MADQVDEVKQKVDIVSLIGEYLSLKKAGKNYKALCPFHAEKTPSFMVSPELQIYKCFGCSESGDAIAFLQKYEGMEFREALKFLADRVGVKLEVYHPEEVSQKEKIYEINRLASKFYQYILLNHKRGKKALSYLTEQRGLRMDTIKKFMLGYSPEIPEVLPKLLIEKKKIQTQELGLAGLTYFKDGRPYDRFWGRIIFPLFDHRNNPIAFAGRILPTEKNQDLAKYINSPETPTYHKSKVLFALNLVKDEIKKNREAVVVEGELDAISCWQAGIKNVVAIKGTALTEDQVNLISRFAEKLTLALDTDLAGDTAARRGIVLAQDKGLDLKVARLGDYKDPDEMVRQNPEGFKDVLAKALGVWDFFVSSTFAKYDKLSGEGKAKISREIIPVLASIPDKIVQAHYIEKVADLLAIPALAVSEQLGQFKDKVQPVYKLEIPVTKPEKQKPRRQLLEEILLSLIFQEDSEILFKEDLGDLIRTRALKLIVEEFGKYRTEKKEFDPSAFAEKLPKELFETFSEIILKDNQELLENKGKFRQELENIKKEINILDIKERLNKLALKIKEFEARKDKVKLRTAQENFSTLTRKLVDLEQENYQSIIQKQDAKKKSH